MENNDLERLALNRVIQSGVKASDIIILRWIRSVGPENIMQASLQEIRDIANAF